MEVVTLWGTRAAPSSFLWGGMLAESCHVVSKLKCPVFLARDMSGLSYTTSGRRGCGKVGIPRLLRDFQARWESRVLDFSTSRLFHSPSRRGFAFCQGRTQSAVSI